MKVEVLFVGGSIDADMYEGESVTWIFNADQLCIYTGGKDEESVAASYPAGRVVRVRVVEAA